MLVEENTGEFNSSDCLEYKTLANSVLHRIWRIRIGFLREKTLAIIDQSAKFANVFSCQRFTLYGIHNTHRYLYGILNGEYRLQCRQYQCRVLLHATLLGYQQHIWQHKWYHDVVVEFSGQYWEDFLNHYPLYNGTLLTAFTPTHHIACTCKNF